MKEKAIKKEERELKKMETLELKDKKQVKGGFVVIEDFADI